MRWLRGGFLFVLATAGPLLGPESVFAELVPVGSEFQVSAFTAGAQKAPSVAGSESGFVVIWNNAPYNAVMGRRFASSGAALGEDFVVRSGDLDNFPRIAAADPGFVVVWDDYVLGDGDMGGISALRFDSTGNLQGSRFVVNAITLGPQGYGNVAMEAGGQFVVVWVGGVGVRAQRFSSTGARVGGEFGVNSSTGSMTLPAVAMDAQGFVVVWSHLVLDGDMSGIFGRRFDSAGNPIGAEFLVNTVTQGNQTSPAVTKNEEGFLVIWSGSDGAEGGVLGRSFDNAGVARGPEFRVNADPARSQDQHSLASAGGSFLVAWTDAVPGPFKRVQGRALGSLGAPSGSDAQIDAYPNGQQQRPSVGRSGSHFVVVWSSGLQDGSSTGVFARRYEIVAELDVDGNGVVGPLTDTLLVMRYAFGFRGDVLIAGAIGDGCTRCDAPSIEAFLAAKI